MQDIKVHRLAGSAMQLTNAQIILSRLPVIEEQSIDLVPKEKLIALHRIGYLKWISLRSIDTSIGSGTFRRASP
jgi:hypothetical protein